MSQTDTKGIQEQVRLWENGHSLRIMQTTKFCQCIEIVNVQTWICPRKEDAQNCLGL